MQLLICKKIRSLLSYSLYISFYLIHKQKTRFTKAERELQAARPFGYAPRKFYESSHLVKPEKKDAKGAPEAAAVAPETPKVEDKEAEKTTKRLYVAITSDRGNFCVHKIKQCLLSR